MRTAIEEKTSEVRMTWCIRRTCCGDLPQILVSRKGSLGREVMPARRKTSRRVTKQEMVRSLQDIRQRQRKKKKKAFTENHQSFKCFHDFSNPKFPNRLKYRTNHFLRETLIERQYRRNRQLILIDVYWISKAIRFKLTPAPSVQRNMLST